ncbi:MAG TPA: hypothetical protein QGF05_04270 [Dehalococcoidia bacterium]|nr:hypothetical protein [Dehalococcoidia bacterium]
MHHIKRSWVAIPLAGVALMGMAALFAPGTATAGSTVVPETAVVEDDAEIAIIPEEVSSAADGLKGIGALSNDDRLPWSD